MLKIMATNHVIKVSNLIKEGKCQELENYISRNHIDYDEVDNETEETMLHMASRHRQLEIAAFLLRNGSDIKHLNKAEQPPIYHALSNLDKPMSVMLIQAGANPRAVVNGSPILAEATKYYLNPSNLLSCFDPSKKGYYDIAALIDSLMAELVVTDHLTVNYIIAEQDDLKKEQVNLKDRITQLENERKMDHEEIERLKVEQKRTDTVINNLIARIIQLENERDRFEVEQEKIAEIVTKLIDRINLLESEREMQNEKMQMVEQAVFKKAANEAEEKSPGVSERIVSWVNNKSPACGNMLSGIIQVGGGKRKIIEVTEASDEAKKKSKAANDENSLHDVNSAPPSFTAN